MTIRSNYFYGNKVSDYGIEHGYVDYATLAKAFDAVLNNDIITKTYDIGIWEQLSGMIDNYNKIEELKEKIEDLEEYVDKLENKLRFDEAQDAACGIEELKERIEELEQEEEDSYSAEIFQYYIVSSSGAEILQEINEIVFYNEEFDMYVWGVTHCGTSWDYVLTDIKIEKYENQ